MMMNTNRRTPTKTQPRSNATTPVSTKKPQSPKSHQSGRSSVPQTPQNKRPMINRQHSSQPEFNTMMSPVVPMTVRSNSNPGRSMKASISPKPQSPVSDPSMSPTSRGAARKSQGSPFGHIPFAASKYLESPITGKLPVPPKWMLTMPSDEPRSPTTEALVQAAIRNGFNGSININPFQFVSPVCA